MPVWKSIARALAFGSLLAGIGGCEATLFNTLGVLDQNTVARAHNDIVFDHDHALALDVYTPRADSNVAAPTYPVVVFFYGGTWQNGKRAWYRFVGERLASHGIVVVIPDYRKFPQSPFPTFIEDGAQALAWTRANIAQFGGDPKNIFVMGHSAGAHIGALLVTDQHYLAAVDMSPRDIAGFIGLAGPYDFAPIVDPELIRIFGANAAAQRNAQPITFVDGNEPPMLLLQGLDDKYVWPANSAALAQRMREFGEPVQVKFYPEVSHAKILFALSRVSPDWAPVLDDTLRFIAEHAHNGN